MRQAYLVADRGAVRVNGRDLAPGDGAVVHGESAIEIQAVAPASVVIAERNFKYLRNYS